MSILIPGMPRRFVGRLFLPLSLAVAASWGAGNSGGASLDQAPEHFSPGLGADFPNGNLSNGMIWDTETIGGEPLGRSYAEARRRWEPVVDVTQVKGDSETHPILSPTDEFADFERWDKYNIMNTVETTPEMLPGSYAWSALNTGLALGRELGINPFPFGMIGSTDSHTSLATAAEDHFFGKFDNAEPGVRDPASRMAGM